MKVFIHIGCHKSGTTYLQNMLRLNSECLLGSGVGFFPLPDFRRKILPAAIRSDRPFDYIVKLAVDKFGDRIDRLLISDENIIGTCSQFVESGIAYQSSTRRLKKITSTDGDAAFFICIRKPSQFIASAWAEAIRFRDYVTFSEFIEKVSKNGFSWFEVISRIKESVRGRNLYVWRYEDNEHGIDSLLQISSNKKIKLSDLDLSYRVNNRPSMSQEGFELLNLMDRFLGESVVSKYSREIARRAVVGVGTNKLNIMPSYFGDELDKIYDRDFQKLDELPGVFALRPQFGLDDSAMRNVE